MRAQRSSNACLPLRCEHRQRNVGIAIVWVLSRTTGQPFQGESKQLLCAALQGFVIEATMWVAHTQLRAVIRKLGRAIIDRDPHAAMTCRTSPRKNLAVARCHAVLNEFGCGSDEASA